MNSIIVTINLPPFYNSYNQHAPILSHLPPNFPNSVTSSTNMPPSYNCYHQCVTFVPTSHYSVTVTTRLILPLSATVATKLPIMEHLPPKCPHYVTVITILSPYCNSYHRHAPFCNSCHQISVTVTTNMPHSLTATTKFQYFKYQ